MLFRSGHKYDKWVNFLTPICVGIRKFLDFIHPPIRYVKIDPWDTWNMYNTLADIILPMLKQLKETKHGSPVVALEDVPEELRYTETYDYDSQYTFEFYEEDQQKKVECDIHGRWDWVLGEMIFAFERINDDSWEDEFRSGEIDTKSVPCAWDENGKATLYGMEYGPNHTYKCDYDGMQKVQDRINNGLRLFGTYFQNLWD